MFCDVTEDLLLFHVSNLDVLCGHVPWLCFIVPRSDGQAPWTCCVGMLQSYAPWTCCVGTLQQNAPLLCSIGMLCGHALLATFDGCTHRVGKCKSVRSPQQERVPHILLQANQDIGTPEVGEMHYNMQSYSRLTKRVGGQPAGTTCLSIHDNESSHVKV